MKKLHVIVLMCDGSKGALKTLKYEDVSELSLKELEEYMDAKDYFDGCNCLDLDDTTIRDLIVYYANKNKKINWFLDYDRIKVKTLFKVLKREEIFLNNTAGVGGAGGFGGILDILSLIKTILKHIFHLGKYLSYRKMIDYTCQSKDFIIDVINGIDKKNIGFISNEDFKWKNLIEFFIMKDLGYKRKNGMWV